jgi:hypothetical protein
MTWVKISFLSIGTYCTCSVLKKFLLFLIALFFILLGLTAWIDVQVSSLSNFANQTEKFHTALNVYPISLIAAVLVTTLATWPEMLDIATEHARKIHKNMAASFV